MYGIKYVIWRNTLLWFKWFPWSNWSRILASMTVTRKYDIRQKSIFRNTLTFLKLMWTTMTHPLLPVWFICLDRGTGIGWFISVLLNRISPAVCLFTINTTTVKMQFSLTKTEFNISLILLLNKIPVFVHFTRLRLRAVYILWTVDNHFLFLYSRWGLFFRETLTKSCPGIVEKRLTLWS